MDTPQKNNKTQLRHEMNFHAAPVATDILKQFYSTLKDKNAEGQYWSQDIEDACKAKMKVIMEQVYEILYQKQDVWEPSDEELYSLLERVIFLKARENTFRDFFDNMENVIEAASQLDFSKRLPFSEISSEKRNLFNYAVMCLNILVEKMETSVVSMKVVNTMLSSMPRTIMLVTDNKGAIRFVNDLGEKLLGLKKQEYIGKSVSLLLNDHEEINKEYAKGDEIKNKRVSLIATNGREKSNIPVLLTILKPLEEHTEIDEIIYCMSMDHTFEHAREKQFDLTQEFQNKIAPLNTIIESANQLDKRFSDQEGKKLMGIIKWNAGKLKADLAASLTSLVAKEQV